MKFATLHKSSVEIAVFSNASSARIPDWSPQLGFVIVLKDKDEFANILHYTSVKSNHVTRSFLAAELYDAINAFYYAITLRLTLNEILGRVVAMTL